VSTGKIILVVLATVVIFATGIVTGGMLVKQSSRPPPAPQPVFNRFELSRRAVNQLDLTPEQRGRIERIIRENQDRIADYFQILEPDMQGTFRKMQADIRAELTPEQRRRFEEKFQRLRGRALRGGLAPESRGGEPDAGPGVPPDR
jgi:Spy/CpxP family protein refolding chaperone